MSIEEVKCNGEVKLEVLSSSDGLLTYRRRKRTATGGESRYPQGGDAAGSADEEVFHLGSSQGKGKDFGWEHGKMINGNRYHWKCKWCNFVGRSGGVTRLKKHLAGGWQVTPCAKVPRNISNTMNNHLIELRKKRLFNRKRKREQDDMDEPISEVHPLNMSVDEDHGQVGLSLVVTNETEQFGRAVKSFETDSQQSRDSYPGSESAIQHLNTDIRDSYPGSKSAIQHLNTDMAKVSDASQKSMRTARRYRTANRRSRASYRRPRAVTQQFNTDMAKVVKEPRDIMFYTDIYEQDDLSRTDSHWRSVLKHMLQLPYVCEGGGIGSSINEALTHGPPGDNRESKMANGPMDTSETKDRHKGHFEVPGQSVRMGVSENTSAADVSETGTYDQTDAVPNKKKCHDVFYNILCSESFVSLCNLLCESFHGIKIDKLFDVSQLSAKMKNGIYEQSPGLFNQDLQQVWRKFQKVGEEMVHLASSLLNMSQDSFQNQVGEDFVRESCLQKCEVNCQVIVAKNSNDSDTATQFPSCESVPSTKPDQTVASGLYKVCTCKQCGTEADGERSLICDECEAVYHFSCVEPTVQEIPTRSWYCTSCSKERTQSSEHPVKNTHENGLHDNCAVCERLEISETKELVNESGKIAMAIGSRESSVSSMESDEPPEPSRTALARLCKQCGTCEDEDKRFLICGHSQCPYKFYHIRCLTTSQIASLQQVGQHCWYCPSCLCRACFRDKDDDMIVLCDNCDEAYHTYCMKPPRTSIPKGQWYCLKCNVAKAKEGMRRYEQWVLSQHGKKDVRQTNIEVTRSMDVLLSAVEKLSSEENLAAGKKEE